MDADVGTLHDDDDDDSHSTTTVLTTTTTKTTFTTTATTITVTTSPKRLLGKRTADSSTLAPQTKSTMMTNVATPKHHNQTSSNGSDNLVIFYISSYRTYSYNSSIVLECLCAALLQWRNVSKSKNVTEGSNVTFICDAHWSNRMPVSSNTQWYINNVTVDEEVQRKINFWLSDDMTSMTFTNVSWKDALNIQCRVTQNNQSIYNCAYLNVLARTEVNIHRTISKTDENVLTLGVTVYKDPLLVAEDFQIQWFVVQYGGKSHEWTRKEWISLNIGLTRKVQCVVWNKYQTVSKEIIVEDLIEEMGLQDKNIKTVPDEPSAWVKHVAWSSVVIVLIIATLVVLKKKSKWIQKKWKERKEKQRVRFRVALAAACNFQNSNKYVDMPRHQDDFPVERIRFLDTIGEGNFGKIMKAEALDINSSGTWELVAVKMWKDTATDSMKESFYHEMMMMKKIPKYVHVVAFLGYNLKSDPAFLVMEYIPGGDLLTFLRKRRPENAKKKQAQQATDLTFVEGTTSPNGCSKDEKSDGVVSHTAAEEGTDDAKANAEVTSANLVSSKDLASFAMQICRGMAHLSNNKIIHRDVAARNVLVGVGNVCKISDLGLARDVEGCDAYERSSLGPLPIRWMSPESLKDGLYTYKSDVWSFGVVLWEIVTLGASPYSGMSARQVMAAVTEGKRLEKPAFCSDQIYKIMTDCWSSAPDQRPTFSQLVKTVEELLEQEAEYIQLEDYEEGIYDVIDPNDVDIEEERL
ncbi:fibroblast growth factor receptor 3-like [Gigantopelta aegis]|uniref:fibroblast growth factor receptor 3-like n=1 Tax=Gigantopelta aegis TaxID=1735272 RepID=UPI001B889ADF|nr:fibroblast growth factor receptor 3-like [Gigantopelta aegis]